MTNKTIDKSYENFGRYIITEDEFKTLSSDEKTNWERISVEYIVEKYDNMTGLGKFNTSEEAIKKNSEAHKGEKHYMYGKHLTEETRNKIGEGNKGKKFSEDAKKKMSCSWDYKKHFTEETKERMSAAQKGKHWYTNGKETKFCFEFPPGFVPGRLQK